MSKISLYDKATKRTGWVERNVVHPESVADHMYRMATLAFLVDPKQGLNKDKYSFLYITPDDNVNDIFNIL